MESNPNGMRIVKWSSKRQDNATRVRNNQRRHRENARNYVKELEAKLTEGQLKLQEALETIERLRTELPSAQRLSSDKLDSGKCSTCGGTLFTPSDASHHNDEEKTKRSVRTSHYPSEDLKKQKTQLNANPVLSEAPAGTSCCVYNQTAEDEVEYSTRPPGEEACTTLCREAYMIISQQNYAGVEESVIYQWLEPGFRGPSAKQAGCRVDNQTLFRLLDYISSSKYT